MVDNIDISIIIPPYNSEITLSRALASTKNQGSSFNTEIIVVDDHSDDNTYQCAKDLAVGRKHTTVIQTSKNIGASGARNHGIEYAKGEFVAFLDADDIWLPYKLEKQLRALNLEPNCTIVTCDSLKVRPDGIILSQGHQNKAPSTGTDAWKTLLRYNFMPTPTVFTITSLVRECGGFDESLLVGEDLDLWISLARKGSVSVVDEILVQYFDYDNSLMKRSGPNSSLLILEMIERHINSEDRLNYGETQIILAQRQFELAIQCLSFGQYSSALRHFGLAQEYGCSKQRIRKVLFKHHLKSLLKKKWP